jgi:plastocyanin
MRKMLIALVALTALTGAACGGGGDDNGGATGGSTAGATGGATGSTSAGCTADNATDLTGDNPFVVTIKDLKFTPECFAAKSASSITIENQDTVIHTFTIDGTQVDVTIAAGDTFNGESAGLDPGTYAFHCKIHASMKGTVIVS